MLKIVKDTLTEIMTEQVTEQVREQVIGKDMLARDMKSRLSKGRRFFHVRAQMPVTNVTEFKYFLVGACKIALPTTLVTGTCF